MAFIGCILHNASACNAIGMVNTMTSNDYIVVGVALTIGIVASVIAFARR